MWWIHFFCSLYLLLVLNLKIEKLFIESNVCVCVSHRIKAWRIGMNETMTEQNEWKNWHIIITLHQNRFRSLEVECVVKVCFVRLSNANNACLHYLNQYFFSLSFHRFSPGFSLCCFDFASLRFGLHILYAKADTSAHSHTDCLR